MSTEFLRLIPINPKYVPKKAAQKRARQLLADSLAKDVEVSDRVEAEPVFVDAGGYTESIHCPLCSRRLTDDWWAEAMDYAYQKRFSDLAVATPCCKKRSSLNDLRYSFPAGFGRYILEAVDPNIGGHLDPKLRMELEKVLGCQLREIWSRY